MTKIIWRFIVSSGILCLPLLTLKAEQSVSVAPVLGIPVGYLADYFTLGSGLAFWYRPETKTKYLSFLRDLSLEPIAALSFSSYSLQQRTASRIFFFESWVAVGYPLNLPYQIKMTPRIGTGLYYADFLMAGRADSMAILNSLVHVGNSLQYPLNRELLAEFSQGLTANYIGKPIFFYQLNFSLGITLRIGQPPVISSPTSELRASIINNYEKGDYLQASKEIDALEKIVPDDLIIEKYRSLIYQQQRREEAAKHRQEGRLYRAIVLLKQAPDIPDAVNELAEIRESLMPQVDSFLKAGIAAYEKSDFDACIANMEKILLIDPSHSEAQIYLPRAINRRKALQRLK